MQEEKISLCPNILVQYLKKPANEFTKEDIIKFIGENEIEMVNFRYVGEDGKLKTLNFVILGREHLESVLTSGERVDGSSLFSFIEAGSSDLYVIPRFKTAFVNPFTEIPTLDILCSFYNIDGKPLENAPEYILKKAYNEFHNKTGFVFKALGELEYYIISDKEDLYKTPDQKGYHESSPFIKWDILRNEAIRIIAACGGKIKYAHSEVGNFSDDNFDYEQHEIEFLPQDVDDAADHLVIAKWILRNLAEQHNVNISFAPKITVGKAGSGLHIHMLIEKDGKNIMIENNKLSDTAKKIIAGLSDLAASLTAFGNTIPTSYLRLVPHQEAPTNICWGDRNRSVLIRVPLGWLGVNNMINDANPHCSVQENNCSSKQTVELRSPDGSADIYFLLAGIIVAAQHGLEMPDALKKANDLYVDVNIFKDEHKDKMKTLKQLPASCWESAEILDKQRIYYEKNNIFPPGTIDNIIKRLKSFDDKGLSEKLFGKNEEIRSLVDKYIHCM
jgi:glutamine synthetase